MKKTKKTLIFFLTIMIIIIFSSCFSPWKEDEAFIVINLGGGSGRALAWDPEKGVMPEFLGLLDYEITLSGAGSKTFTVKSGNTIRTSVSPGLWDVKVEAKYDEILFAAGTGSVDVIMGQDNPVTIKMNETDYIFFVVGSYYDWVNAINLIGDNEGVNPGKGYVIAVTKDFSTTNLLPLGTTSITICGSHTVKFVGTGTGNLLNINNIGKTVTMHNLKLVGKNDIQNDALVQVTDGTFIMEGSASVSGNKSTSDGGGVHVTTSGTFIMRDNAAVSDNEAKDGGGVYVMGGKFIMEGGVISDNTATNGGGVFVTGNLSIFTMNSGKVSGNEAKAPSGSTTPNNGGGVYVDSGTFTMEGGLVSDNTASGASGGGGVYVTGNGTTFILDGGYVSGNTGGGVNVGSAIFTMSGGEVSGNIGSGVRISGVSPGGTFTMSGGKVSGNTTNIGGGGVHIDTGTFTMTGGTISGNTANGTGGGGVYTAGTNATFHIVTGTVYGSENSIDASLRNNATNGAALLIGEYGGTAQRGTYTGSTWNNAGDLNTRNETLRVSDGVVQ